VRSHLEDSIIREKAKLAKAPKFEFIKLISFFNRFPASIRDLDVLESWEEDSKTKVDLSRDRVAIDSRTRTSYSSSAHASNLAREPRTAIALRVNNRTKRRSKHHSIRVWSPPRKSLRLSRLRLSSRNSERLLGLTWRSCRWLSLWVLTLLETATTRLEENSRSVKDSKPSKCQFARSLLDLYLVLK
jgi:hypothetical protein